MRQQNAAEENEEYAEEAGKCQYLKGGHGAKPARDEGFEGNKGGAGVGYDRAKESALWFACCMCKRGLPRADEVWGGREAGITRFRILTASDRKSQTASMAATIRAG